MGNYLKNIAYQASDKAPANGGLDPLIAVREQMVNATLVAIVLLSFPALIGVFYLSAEIGWRPENIACLAGYAVIVATTLKRSRLSFSCKSTIVLVVWFVTGTAIMATWGLAGMGIPVLLTGVVYSALSLGGRGPAVAGAVAGFAIILGGFLHTFHGKDSLVISTYLTTTSAWILAVSVSGLLIVIITVSINRLNQSLKEAVVKLQAHSKDLEQVHGDLENRVIERTAELAISRQDLESANKALEAAILKANQMTADSEIRTYELEIEMDKRKKTEAALRDSEQKYRSIIETIEDGYCEIDLKGNFILFNDAFCRLCGHSREALAGMKSAAMLEKDSKERIVKAYADVYREGTSLSCYGYDIVRKDGEKRRIETSVVLIRDTNGKKIGFRGVVRDVEERKQFEKQLIYQAYHDALTGLKNRKAFYEKLKETVNYARRYQSEISLIYLDIDRFKKVNDTLGHDAGDDLLKQIAERLISCLRETDFIARVGGDEFAAILNTPYAGRPDVAAARIVESIGKPYRINGIVIDYVSASVGISRYPGDSDNIQTLVNYADTAMYQAKRKRSCYICYKNLPPKSGLENSHMV